jgi:hypothetical protein
MSGCGPPPTPCLALLMSALWGKSDIAANGLSRRLWSAFKDLFVVPCFPKNPAILLQSKTASRNVAIGDSKALCRTNTGIERPRGCQPTRRRGPSPYFRDNCQLSRDTRNISELLTIRKAHHRLRTWRPIGTGQKCHAEGRQDHACIRAPARPVGALDCSGNHSPTRRPRG